ncbi:hypothetical protein [Beijerinckia indica]|uniref:hypothetical protein n=1 Tax=Beijerinckia indica TaxID=533 RepID=UPI0011D140E7|nr:hypothetical protein [Beijerinckia indica]
MAKSSSTGGITKNTPSKAQRFNVQTNCSKVSLDKSESLAMLLASFRSTLWIAAGDARDFGK